MGYNYDHAGRPTGITGSGYAGVSSYVNSIAYRAFGLKQMAYANGRTLSLSYDNRMRLTGWDTPGVMGWSYAYSYFNENSDRVTGRSSNQAFQPHRFTTYERDANGGDDGMFRRYQVGWSRFVQPDPYDGSYNLADPQSLNRYSYVQNDPVNFIDPSGLDIQHIWIPVPQPSGNPYVGSGAAGDWGGFLPLAVVPVGTREGTTLGQKPPPGKYSNDPCIDRAYREYRAAWNAAGLNLTGKALAGFNAARPHLDDLVPLSIGAIVGFFARESFGPIATGVSNMYAPGKRLYNVTVSQNNKERELVQKHQQAVSACQTKSRTELHFTLLTALRNRTYISPSVINRTQHAVAPQTPLPSCLISHRRASF